MKVLVQKCSTAKNTANWTTNLQNLFLSIVASTCWCGPRPRLGWVKITVDWCFPRVPVTPGIPLTQTNYSPCCPLNDRKRAAHSLLEISRLFSLFSCPSSLFLFLTSGNVQLKLCPVFPCSVCAENVTWRGRLVQ